MLRASATAYAPRARHSARSEPYVLGRGVFLFAFGLVTLFGRMLFPVGDEPDFAYRVYQVLQGTSGFDPYFAFGWLTGWLDYSVACEPGFYPASLWGTLDSTLCQDGFANVVIRSFLTLLVVTPLVWCMYSRTATRYALQYEHGGTQDRVQRVNALAIALLWPSMTYYFGVLAFEQVTLAASLAVFVFYRRLTAVVVALGIVLIIDPGNFLIVAFFVALAKVQTAFVRRRRIAVAWLVLIGFCALALLLGTSLLQSIPIFQEKAGSILNLYDAIGDILAKYPVWLRPMITAAGFVFITPAGVKVVVAYVAAAGLALVVLRRMFGGPLRTDDREVVREDAVLAICALTTVLFFVFTLPTYAQAKYYIFVLPFLFKGLLHLFSAAALLRISISFTVLIYAGITVYYL